MPHAPPAERPRLLRSLGYASAVAMVLFLAAAAAQAVALSRGAAECALACGSCGEEPGGGGGAAAAWQEACAASAPACECGYELLGRRSEAVALTVPDGAADATVWLGFVTNGTAADDGLVPVAPFNLDGAKTAAARVPLPGLDTRTELGSLGAIRANATASGWLLTFDGVYFELPLLGLYSAPSELLAGASSTRVPARPEPVARPLPSPWAGRLWWETALQLLACTCAGLTAVIAVFYTTECGGSRYLHAWSDAFLSAHGVGAQQQAVLDSWFFAPDAEDRPLLPRDRERSCRLVIVTIVA